MFGLCFLTVSSIAQLSACGALRLGLAKLLLAYQLAFFTPGIWPLYASSRNQIRQMPYFLKYACGRPQILQRLYSLVENFAGRCCLIFIEVLAMDLSSCYLANGILNNVKSSRASSSVLAVVTKMISIPLTLSTLSYSISGKINCSLIPRA